MTAEKVKELFTNNKIQTNKLVTCLGLNIQDNNGNTPLHLVFKQKNIKLIIKMLQHHADYCIQNNENRTPYYYINDNQFAHELLFELLRKDLVKSVDLLEINVEKSIIEVPLGTKKQYVSYLYKIHIEMMKKNIKFQISSEKDLVEEELNLRILNYIQNQNVVLA